MFPVDALLAKSADTQTVRSAAKLLKRAVERRLHEIRWVLRGSIILQDALCPDLGHGLDLDIFVVIPNKTVARRTIAAIAEEARSVSARNKWGYEDRVLNIRLTIQRDPKLTIDISVLLQTSTLTERLCLDAQSVGETDVLEPNLPVPQPYPVPLLTTWMNFKHWAKSFLPWESRPSTHLLRSMLLDAVASNHAPRGFGWPTYTELVERIYTHIEVGDYLACLRQRESLSKTAESTLGHFVPCLKAYADDLKDMSILEHRNLLGHWRDSVPRLRVFVSSRQREFEAVRAILARRVPLRVKFLLSENFFPWELSARNGMEICEAAIEDCNVFIGIYGNEYGHASRKREHAPIEEELMHARKHIPLEGISLYLREGSSPQPALKRFLARRVDSAARSLHQDIDRAAAQIISDLLAQRTGDKTVGATVKLR